MLQAIAETFGNLFGPLRLFGSYLFLAGFVGAFAMVATFWVLPRCWALLPKDQGRAFAVGAEASVGKPMGAGILFVPKSSSCVRAAVLGLFGLVGPRVAAGSERIDCPVFFIRQLDDEVHDPQSSQALFDRLAGSDKHLRSSSGRHEAVLREVHEEALAFLAAKLRTAV